MSEQDLQELKRDVAALRADVDQILPMLREMYQARGGRVGVSLNPRTWPPSSRRAATLGGSAATLAAAIAWALLEFLAGR